MQTVDNIIIGAGPGGYELAAMLSARGESTVIIERDLPGGTCLNRGCIPTKCLCAAAVVIATVGHGRSLGVNAIIDRVDYDAVRAHMTDVVTSLRQGVEFSLRDATVVRGDGIINSRRRVCVGEQVYEAARRLVIATGSAPASLNIPGAELACDSTDALNWKTLPESLVIIGAGVIGLEFASVYNMLGVKVTVIEFCPEILPQFESDVAKRLRQTLTRRGITFMLSTTVNGITGTPAALMVSATGKKGSCNVETERVIIAVGRRPVIPTGTAEAGIALTPRGYIAVNEMMETSVPGIYAIGDVNGLSMLAHSAIAQGRVVADGNPSEFNTATVPSVVFTTPSLAAVGPTSAALTRDDISFSVMRKSFAANGKACTSGEGDGVVKMLVGDDGTILAATILGPHSAELIAEATILVTDRRRFDEISRRYIHAHPTLSEIFT